jgi:hypothetical protein
MMDMHSVAYLKALNLAGLNKTIKPVGGGKSLATIKTPYTNQTAVVQHIANHLFTYNVLLKRLSSFDCI